MKIIVSSTFQRQWVFIPGDGDGDVAVVSMSRPCLRFSGCSGHERAMLWCFCKMFCKLFICYKFVRAQGKDKYCPVGMVCVVCMSVTPEKVYRSGTFTATISIGVFFHWWNLDHVDSEIPSHCRAICTTKVITTLQLGRCLVLCSTVTIHVISALSFQDYHAYFIFLLSYRAFVEITM